MSTLLVAAGLALAAPAARADSAPLDPADPATPVTVTADALPTTQINGVVWSQVVVGNTVYVAGRFTSARPAGVPAGTQETPRRNLLAYDIRTGQLLTSFAPDLNGQALVVTASPDGSRIYVGGDFTMANGQLRNRVAAYDTATGALVSTWKPSANGTVRAIAATPTTVYLGGGFSALGSTSRTRLAAVSAATGALLPWAPVPGYGSTSGNVLPVWQSPGVPQRDANGNVVLDPRNSQVSNDVYALVTTNGGTQVVAAGRFDSLNGTKSTGIGALDASTGATRPFAAGQLVTNQGINSAVYSLSTDGTTVYGTAYDYWGPGNIEGAFAVDPSGGKLLWASTCRGDTYSSAPVGGALYIATHVHQCQNIGAWLDTDPETFHYGAAYSRAAVGVNGPFTWQNANFVGTRAPAILPWWPTFAAGSFTGQYQAGWSVAGNDRYVVYGGEFPKVNGVAQQGLVRFALPGTAPGKVGPTGGGATPTLTPAVVSLSPGTARVSWRESIDQDNANLTYRVYRDGGTTPVYEVTSASSWYDTQLLGFTDTGLTAGTHTYRVGVVDPQGNKNTGGTTSVTVAAGTTPARPYADVVRADGATDLWTLGERSGTTSWDRANGSDLTLNGGVAVGQAGAIAGDTDTAASFNGTNTGFAVTKTPILAPQTFSMETWFSTRTTAGGKLLGFGANATGTSIANDRNVWMSTTGRVNFGVWPMTNKIVSSAQAYNDGRWHHLVATFTSGSMALYVDGVQVGSRTDVLMAQPIVGYWRVGGDTTWDGAQFFNGKMDEVAVYPSVLSAGQVANHYAAGTTGTPTNTAPTAAFTSTVAQLTASFDGSGSTDADGRVAAWSWSFGDGTTGTGATATHTYAVGGTYAVTLTVTDDKGATASRTATVTVAAPKPNQAPTAAFTSATAGRTASFDASTSKDADGTVAGFAWDFGDGTRGDGVKASHVYAADGSYPVTLTVTDDKGATATASGTVTVSSASLAADGFQRTVSGGWGTADAGGPWTAWAGATRQSVAPGTGSLDLTVGTNTGSYLGAVQQTSVDVTTTMSLSATPTGGGASVYVTGRRVATNQEYRARLRFLSTGQVMVGFTRLAGTSSEALVGTEVALPGTYTPGTALTVRVQVSGTGTTTLAATVWPAGTAQPATATLTRTDATASLQAAGSIGVAGYLSGTATAPVSVRVTRFSAVPAA